MKKHAATLLILAMVGLPGLVNAQIRKVVKAEVPFEFMVNGKTMPAGPCTIEINGDGQTILMINNEAQHLFAIPNATESLHAAEETALLFHEYQGRYFLAGVNRQGEKRGYELPAGKLEVELRAENRAETDVILLAYAK